jgi:hypothetical protein
MKVMNRSISSKSGKICPKLISSFFARSFLPRSEFANTQSVIARFWKANMQLAMSRASISRTIGKRKYRNVRAIRHTIRYRV